MMAGNVWFVFKLIKLILYPYIYVFLTVMSLKSLLSSPDSSSRSSMQFGKGGLKASGRDSMLSQSSNYSATNANASARDSSHGSISLDKRPSRTRSEMMDAIKANRQGSGTSLNVISIVNTSSFNVNPSSVGNTANQRRRSLSLGLGDSSSSSDVITIPRRISKVMGFNKLEFNPMALDQERSGPLLELGKEEKKGKLDERLQKQQPVPVQVSTEGLRRGTCILDDNVLGRNVGEITAAVGISIHEDLTKKRDSDIKTMTNNNPPLFTSSSSQAGTSDNTITVTSGSTYEPASSALPKPPSYPHPTTMENTIPTPGGMGTAHDNSSTHPPAVPTTTLTPTPIPAAFVPVVKDQDLLLPDELLENFDLPHGPITPTVARVVLSVLKQGGKLSMKSVHKILRIGYRLLMDLPNTTICTLSPQDRLTVVGDIHGQVIQHKTRQDKQN